MYFISVQNTLISIGLISKGAVFVGPICTWSLANVHYQGSHRVSVDDPEALFVDFNWFRGILHKPSSPRLHVEDPKALQVDVSFFKVILHNLRGPRATVDDPQALLVNSS